MLTMHGDIHSSGRPPLVAFIRCNLAREESATLWRRVEASNAALAEGQ